MIIRFGDRVFCVGHFLLEVWKFITCCIVLDIIELDILWWTHSAGQLLRVVMCWKMFRRCFLLDKGLFSVGMLGQVAYSWKVKDSMFSVGLKTDWNVFRGCRQSLKLLVESIYFKSATISYQHWRETLQLQPWFGILWIFESAWKNPHWRLNLQLRPVQIRFCFLWIIKVH